MEPIWTIHVHIHNINFDKNSKILHFECIVGIHVDVTHGCSIWSGMDPGSVLTGVGRY